MHWRLDLFGGLRARLLARAIDLYRGELLPGYHEVGRWRRCWRRSGILRRTVPASFQ
jgi:hypothetical protein